MEASPTVTPPPFVGAVVHYVDLSDKPGGGLVDRAAIVLDLDRDTQRCCLKVTTPGGDHVAHNIAPAPPSTNERYRWHWPEGAE